MTNPNDPHAVMQAFFQAGQAFAQGMAQFVNGQQQDWQAKLGPLTPPAGAQWGEESAELAALREEWRQRHAALWQAMLQRRKGDAAPIMVQPEPGDRRFDHPAWAESPIYDYARPICSTPAT
jgi:polyhydroxyalkanoate synthase